MRSRISGAITYANVTATLALFVALGGGAYAAVKIPRNSVGTSQLKRNAVGTAQIKNFAVTNDKIPGGSLTADRFKPEEFARLRGAQGPAGPPGPGGPAGARGADGPRGPSDIYTGYAESGDFPQGATQGVDIVTTGSVPPGLYAITANVQLSSVGTAEGSMHCNLTQSGYPNDPLDSAEVGMQPGDKDQLALAGVGGAGTPTSFYVHCFMIGTNGPTFTAFAWTDADIGALAVEAVH